MKTFINECFRESGRIYWVLLRISLPLLILIRVLDENFNFISLVGDWLSPIMSFVGLPGQAGIVWATALFLQLYAAMLVLASLWTELNLTTAQATVLATLMLTAHALPVELRIVQKAGVRLSAMLAVRMGGAIILGMLLHAIYSGGDFLQTPATIYFSPSPVNTGWMGWFKEQAKNWFLIYLVILALVTFVRILKATHAEKLLATVLSPLLRLMGIGKQATTTTLIGITLGLSYGGGLLIEASRSGEISRRDMLCVLTLLCLCHSVIEDTLAMLLIGAHVSGVLVARVIFAFVFMAIFAQCIKRLSDSTLLRFMLISK
ncbi:MAG: hypothetical protein ACNYPH_04185 [Gammaproteobacteria bacterium WSBS_2016_MAG_OTU1]